MSDELLEWIFMASSWILSRIASLPERRRPMRELSGAPAVDPGMGRTAATLPARRNGRDRSDVFSGHPLQKFFPG